MKTPLVSIILLNYNNLEFNTACIQSILAQSYKHFEIVFINNESKDGSIEEVQRVFSKEINDNSASGPAGQIIIAEPGSNLGFAGGNNFAMQFVHKDSDYICLLNNDTTVPINWLEELVKGIESDPTLGAVGSMVLDKGHEEEIKKQIFIQKKKFMLSIFGETILDDISDHEAETGILHVTGLSGCCFMFRKDLIQKPFEDYYFAYAEDVYLSRKILSQGYTLGYCTRSVVHHFGSGSFGKKPSPLKLFHGNKNQIINYLLFYNLKTSILLFPLFIIKELGHLAMGYPRLRIKAKLQGRVWIIKNRAVIMRTRQTLMQEKRIQLEHILSHKLTDTYYANNLSGIKKHLIGFINKVFSLYGKVL